MSLSSLPFPWQQKEETWLRAQVSDHWAGWAVGSPLGLQGHWVWAGLCHPLSPSEIPLGIGHLVSCWRLWSPRSGNETQQDLGIPELKTARALLPKVLFCSPTQIPQEITAMQCSCIPWGGPGEAMWLGVVGPDSPGPGGGGWGVPCSLLKGTHFPSSCDSSSPIRKEKKKKTGKKHRRDR